MKANELMIGDWIQTEAGLLQVSGVKDGSVWCVIPGNSYGCEVTARYAIPLTNEILEKNFPSINGLAWWPQDGAFHCESRTNGDIMVSGQFRYVHQLQQALRLVGIEKEIVL